MTQAYPIHVTGRHLHVTDAMKNYATQKVSKLERIAPRILDVHVIMDVQKIDNRVDIILKYANTIIKSHAATTDMYASVDMAVHKLEAQLRKYLSRIHDYYAKGHEEREIEEKIYLAELDEFDLNDQIEKELAKQEQFVVTGKILRTEKQPLKILSSEEAIMKINLSRAPVMVYRDEASRKLRVIYRREDGNYGIIEPE